MTKILIKSIPVSDTLTLHLYDASRKIAGDRWQVNLTARIDAEKWKHRASSLILPFFL